MYLVIVGSSTKIFLLRHKHISPRDRRQTAEVFMSAVSKRSMLSRSRRQKKGQSRSRSACVEHSRYPHCLMCPGQELWGIFIHRSPQKPPNVDTQHNTQNADEVSLKTRPSNPKGIQLHAAPLMKPSSTQHTPKAQPQKPSQSPRPPCRPS
jgi:hypothetical protein